MSKFLVRAPSNIALVKYMGKIDSSLNIPENASVSLTLNSLCTYVELAREPGKEKSIHWTPELPQVDAPMIPAQLSERGLKRLIRHAERVLDIAPQILRRFGITQFREESNFYLKSANTFPAASGIASSASSFAAITLAMTAAQAENPDRLQSAWQSEVAFRREVASLSRQGSGSSCRSFEGPFVHWEGERAEKVDSTPNFDLAHFVVLISKDEKSVSSSEAHLRVKSSPLWEGRIERANARAKKVVQAIQRGDLTALSKLAWSESWEMHSLFHTSEDPFSYWKPGSIEGLHWLAQYLSEAHPPIVTMDAGPNIHVIVRADERELWAKRLGEHFGLEQVLHDRPGTGAELLG